MGWDDVLPSGLPGAGSIDAVRAAAGTARGLADELRDAAQQGRGQAGVDWRSAAAETFREELEQCVRQLDSCAAELDEAAVELRRFAAAADRRLAALRRIAEAASWPIP